MLFPGGLWESRFPTQHTSTVRHFQGERPCQSADCWILNKQKSHPCISHQPCGLVQLNLSSFFQGFQRPTLHTVPLSSFLHRSDQYSSLPTCFSLAIGKEQWFCLATHKHTPCSPDPLPSLQPSFECSLIIFSLSSIHPVLKVRLGPASLGRRDNISLEYLKKTQHPIDSWTGQLLGSEYVLYPALVGSARTAATSAVCVCRWARKHSSFARWTSSFLSQGWRLLVSFVHLQTTAEKRKKKKVCFCKGKKTGLTAPSWLWYQSKLAQWRPCSSLEVQDSFV